MPKLRTFAPLLILLLALSARKADAQIPINVVAGPTIATISTDDYDTSSKVGFFVAAGTAFPLAENLALMPWVGFVRKGADFSEGSSGNYDYIEIPILIGKQFPLNDKWTLGVDAGPEIAFNVKCDEDGYDCTEYDDFKKTDYGIMAGASLSVPVSETRTFSFGITYDLGLADVFDSESSGGYKNRVFYLFVGLGSIFGG